MQGQSMFTSRSKWTTNSLFFWERLVWVLQPRTNFVLCLASSLWTRLYIYIRKKWIIDVMVDSADTILNETVARVFEAYIEIDADFNGNITVSLAQAWPYIQLWLWYCDWCPDRSCRLWGPEQVLQCLHMECSSIGERRRSIFGLEGKP